MFPDRSVTYLPGLYRLPHNKPLQLPPRAAFQSIRGTVWRLAQVLRRWRSAALGAAERHAR